MEDSPTIEWDILGISSVPALKKLRIFRCVVVLVRWWFPCKDGDGADGATSTPFGGTRSKSPSLLTSYRYELITSFLLNRRDSCTPTSIPLLAAEGTTNRTGRTAAEGTMNRTGRTAATATILLYLAVLFVTDLISETKSKFRNEIVLK